MNIVSVNVNGIRAAARKGFFAWLQQRQPDVVCLQEVRALPQQITDPVFAPEGYHRYFFPAERKGYSGTALYAKKPADRITMGLGWEGADQEGRYLQADFGKLSVASLYLPSGSSSEAAQARKFDFLERLLPVLQGFRRKRREYIICGDWNIAHKSEDLKNWRANQKHSGFLPEERAWLDQLFDDVGWVDAFRRLNQQAHQYTWWSNRGQAWANNVGWRIDYQICTPGIAELAQSTEIYKEERFSDHAPLLMEWDWSL